VARAKDPESPTASRKQKISVELLLIRTRNQLPLPKKVDQRVRYLGQKYGCSRCSPLRS
jgi:hypothetical protein